MPKPTCQLSLTLNVDQAKRVEEIAFATHRRLAGAGKDLMLERLELIDAGWELDDEETKQAVLQFLQRRKSRKKRK